MGLWQRWRNKMEQYASGGSAVVRYGDAESKNVLHQLLQQREAIEQRGCFSDRELEIKEREIEQIDQRIRTLRNQQMRLRNRGNIRV